MKKTRSIAVAFALLCAAGAVHALEVAEPVVGQPGKDVVWVPSPQSMVDRMLAMAEVKPGDTVIDLGSGDGRIVIAAAKRGARAIGIEYNPALVAYARRAAEREGVRAEFLHGDIFQSDFSHATVVTMFLTSELILKLQPRLLTLKPGTRIVSNTFQAVGWEPDWSHDEPLMGDCDVWCTALLWIVPARVAGAWRTPLGLLTLNQQNQLLTGVLHSGERMLPVEGRVRGEEVVLRVGNREYSGRPRDGELELR
jgi:SAM-dependent methyltransferase